MLLGLCLLLIGHLRRIRLFVRGRACLARGGQRPKRLICHQLSKLNCHMQHVVHPQSFHSLSNGLPSSHLEYFHEVKDQAFTFQYLLTISVFFRLYFTQCYRINRLFFYGILFFTNLGNQFAFEVYHFYSTQYRFNLFYFPLFLSVDYFEFIIRSHIELIKHLNTVPYPLRIERARCSIPSYCHLIFLICLPF